MTSLKRSMMIEDLLQSEELARDMKSLPSNYNFEIYKTLGRARKLKAKRVALQMPEGLLMYACVISDILRKYADGAECVVMGDVTYGACCVDDYSARAVGCDFLVHYGHSCLVPVQECSIPILYVFVNISFDRNHLVGCLKLQFPPETRLALLGTIQFVATIHEVGAELQEIYHSIQIPQSRPLSPGEVLGCTAPRLKACDAVVYVADGRFHLEAVMIANPDCKAFRYDPYSKSFTEEKYALREMKESRKEAIRVAASARTYGVVLGTLGRQGSVRILRRVTSLLECEKKEYVVILMSEITPSRLSLFDDSVDAWVQIACPRLSIDWGTHFQKPLLTTYECMVALGHVQWREDYPMDYYAKDGREWSNYFQPSLPHGDSTSLEW